jgi:hypothetical protein
VIFPDELIASLLLLISESVNYKNVCTEKEKLLMQVGIDV